MPKNRSQNGSIIKRTSAIYHRALEQKLANFNKLFSLALVNLDSIFTSYDKHSASISDIQSSSLIQKDSNKIHTPSIKSFISHFKSFKNTIDRLLTTPRDAKKRVDALDAAKVELKKSEEDLIKARNSLKEVLQEMSKRNKKYNEIRERQRQVIIQINKYNSLFPIIKREDYTSERRDTLKKELNKRIENLKMEKKALKQTEKDMRAQLIKDRKDVVNSVNKFKLVQKVHNDATHKIGKAIKRVETVFNNLKNVDEQKKSETLLKTNKQAHINALNLDKQIEQEIEKVKHLAKAPSAKESFKASYQKFGQKLDKFNELFSHALEKLESIFTSYSNHGQSVNESGGTASPQKDIKQTRALSDTLARHFKSFIDKVSHPIAMSAENADKKLQKTTEELKKSETDLEEARKALKEVLKTLPELNKSLSEERTKRIEITGKIDHLQALLLAVKQSTKLAPKTREGKIKVLEKHIQVAKKARVILMRNELEMSEKLKSTSDKVMPAVSNYEKAKEMHQTATLKVEKVINQVEKSVKNIDKQQKLKSVMQQTKQAYKKAQNIEKDLSEEKEDMKIISRPR